MAVDSGSVCKQTVSGKKERVKSAQKKENMPEDNVISASPAKRNNAPGVRVVGGRIYDSVNGKTCHQCRQKTMDLVAHCKSQRNTKPCTIMYCKKCLLNRYGEKVEDVAALEEWSCPKCRGICNCSICMKKRGHQPTGMLTVAAKATGFSSVSEMLLKGVDLLNRKKVVSPNKDSSSRKQGKENSFGGKVDANLPNHDGMMLDEAMLCKGKIDDKTTLEVVNQSPHKRKLKQKPEGLADCKKEVGREEDGTCVSKGKAKKMKMDAEGASHGGVNNGESLETASHDEKKPKKMRNNKLNDVKDDGALQRRTSPRKLKVPDKMLEQAENTGGEYDREENVNRECTIPNNGFTEPLKDDMMKVDCAKTINDEEVFKCQDAVFHPEIPLPMGEVISSVATLDVEAEDVGNALQFLEFCAAFGKILELKKGQPECILRDILSGRSGRRGKFSLSVQFQIQLLSLVLEEQGEEHATLSPSYGKNSWFLALKKYLSESEINIKAHGVESLEKAADYGTLASSEKLSLLNLLCDEVLATDKVRNWMEEQNSKLADKVKEAKQNVLAAKEEEKSVKQKMKAGITQAIVDRNGALSISEHDAIVSRFKREVEQARAKVLESKDILSKNYETANVMRVEPMLVGRDGHVYWKLNCADKSNVLHQDVGKGDTLTLDDKWFMIGEGKEAIEKHICSLRRKRLRS